MEQSKPGFKRTINWDKCESRLPMQTQNQYLDYLVDPVFQGVNRLFVLSFGDNAVRTGHKEYFTLKLEKRNYIVLIDNCSFFDQPAKNETRT